MNLVYVLVFACFCSSLANTESHINNRKTEVDLVIEGLQAQQWTDDEIPCIHQTLHVLNNVKNYTTWAVWIWNSMQHPSGSFYGSKYNLGNYDQCLKAPSNTADPKIITQYCLTDVKLTDKKYGSANIYGLTDNFLNVKNKVGRRSDTITWGTCLPAACNHQSVSKILKTIYLTNPITSIEPDIIVDYCQNASEKTVYSNRFYVFVILMISLVLTAILSSIYLGYDNTDSSLTRIAYSFSLKRNWSSFVRISEEEIPILSFTKTVILIFTTCVHVFVFVLFTDSVSNSHDFDNLISVKKHTMGNTIQHIDLPIVENFFVMSGFLLMKGLMEKNKNPIITLIQRYVRLIGSLSVLIFYTIAVSEYTGDGPLWNRYNGKEQRACSKTWPLSLLMIHNYVDSKNICQLVTWYIPCDYQLAVLGTVLFCLWQWDKRIGKITTIITVVMSVLLPGITTYWKRLPGILFFDMEEFINIRNNEVYLNIYMKSHHRAGPYLLGMATAYIIMTYRPAKYKGIIPKAYSYVGLAAAFIVGLRVLTAAPAWCLGEYNAWSAAVYAALNRNIWALATCACIAITEYGDVESLRKIMAWPGFTIFSRLAYGVYISHSVILQRNLYSQRNPMTYDMLGMILIGVGALFTSAILAVLLWLFVESPLSNLANLVLNPKKKQTHSIENKKERSQTKLTELKNTKTM